MRQVTSPDQLAPGDRVSYEVWTPAGKQTVITTVVDRPSPKPYLVPLADGCYVPVGADPQMFPPVYLVD